VGGLFPIVVFASAQAKNAAHSVNFGFGPKAFEFTSKFLWDCEVYSVNFVNFARFIQARED
jgi:hypothetical protein